jgi:hypothetical protein
MFAFQQIKINMTVAILVKEIGQCEWGCKRLWGLSLWTMSRFTQIVRTLDLHPKRYRINEQVDI